MGEYAHTSPAPRNINTNRLNKSGTMMHSKVKIVAFGQGLSLLLASCWASQSTMYLSCGWRAPAFSCLWVYFLLSFNLCWIVKRHQPQPPPASSAATDVAGADAGAGAGHRAATAAHHPSDVRNSGDHRPHTFLKIIPLQASPLLYFGMSILLFYGNWLSLMAIQYTTITSISMIDAISIPTVMILSRCFLHRKYVVWHIFAAVLCLTGILLNVSVDVRSDRINNSIDSTEAIADSNDGSKEYPHKTIGDLCALTAGILFGVNDVIMERTVRKNKGFSEYLGMIGFFGTFVALFQMCLTERAVIAAMLSGDLGCAPSTSVGLLIAYVLSETFRKMGNATFLTLSEAALLQMSLLTSDIYTALFSIIIQGIIPQGLFWLASILVVTGILVYELGPSPIVAKAIDDPPTDLVMTEVLEKAEGVV